MKLFRALTGLFALASVAACGSVPTTSRNAPFETLPAQSEVAAPMPASAVATRPDVPQRPSVAAPRYKIVDYAIKVPQSLSVSEANLYYPVADIVWRGDPRGNRKQQIGFIFQESIARAMPRIGGDRPVKLDIVVNRFHSVSEKARYTVGGVHSISFYVTLRDAQSGEVLINSRKVKADLAALGGQRALEADSQGLTMKERIQSHLARVIAVELNIPGGWADNGSKIVRAIDQI